MMRGVLTEMEPDLGPTSVNATIRYQSSLTRPILMGVWMQKEKMCTSRQYNENIISKKYVQKAKEKEKEKVVMFFVI